MTTTLNELLQEVLPYDEGISLQRDGRAITIDMNEVNRQKMLDLLGCEKSISIPISISSTIKDILLSITLRGGYGIFNNKTYVDKNISIIKHILSAG